MPNENVPKEPPVPLQESFTAIGTRWDASIHDPEGFAVWQLARVAAPNATLDDLVDVLHPMLLQDAFASGAAPWSTRAAIVAAIRARLAPCSAAGLLEQLGDPLTRRLLPVGCTWHDLETANFLPADRWSSREHAAWHVATYVAEWLDRTLEFPADEGAPA